MADQTAIKKYRPSNGTEGEIFMSEYCFQCARDNYDVITGEGEPCEILGRTMIYSSTDDEYPDEWTYNENGPTCTAFVLDGDIVPNPRCAKTNDMFGELPNA